LNFGYAGKILWVNLKDRTYRAEPTERYQDWIGGRSLGAFLLSKHPDLSQSGVEKQPFAISTGPLVGAGIPMGTRTAVTARNQINGGFCYSNVGGDFGMRLKMAGYDAIVIEEASRTPIYLLVRSSRIEFVPASDLWGKMTSEFLQSMNDRYADEELSYIGIGPAGEKGVGVSCLIVDKGHAAGWGGSGVIFGTKNLKAVVAIGCEKIPVFNEKGLLEKIDEINNRITGSEAMALMVQGGTHGMAGAGGFTGTVPNAVRNMSDEYLPPDQVAPIRESAFRQWEVKRSGCHNCQIKCLHQYSMNSDKYGQMNFEGMHANSVRGLASNWGVADPDVLAKAHTLCNEYGLDVDGVSSVVAFAIECAQHGLLSDDYLQGLKLEWGNGDAAIKLVEEIAEGRGFGKIIGDGVWKAAQTIGNGSQAYAMATKKIGINEQGIRSHRAWALGIVTSTRGGGHLGGSPQVENRKISAEVGKLVFNNPMAGVPDSYIGKGKLVAWTSGMKAIIDSLGLCYFVYSWYDVSLGTPNDLVEILYLTTGIKLSVDDLIQKGIRCHHIERYLSYLLGGFTRKDDTVPDRFFDSSVSDGPYKGSHLDRIKVEYMLDEYYENLGWNKETGLPGSELLKQIGLGYLLEIKKGQRTLDS
jgi:aldehyde:ferredoxin oxidoreductase